MIVERMYYTTATFLSKYAKRHRLFSFKDDRKHKKGEESVV